MYFLNMCKTDELNDIHVREAWSKNMFLKAVRILKDFGSGVSAQKLKADLWESLNSPV